MAIDLVTITYHDARTVGMQEAHLAISDCLTYETVLTARVADLARRATADNHPDAETVGKVHALLGAAQKQIEDALRLAWDLDPAERVDTCAAEAREDEKAAAVLSREDERAIDDIMVLLGYPPEAAS